METSEGSDNLKGPNPFLKRPESYLEGQYQITTERTKKTGAHWQSNRKPETVGNSSPSSQLNSTESHPKAQQPLKYDKRPKEIGKKKMSYT